MNVNSEDDNLEITDSEDEQGEVSKSGGKTTEDGEGPSRVSTLATSKVVFYLNAVFTAVSYDFF
jgi:hypothetical protein